MAKMTRYAFCSQVEHYLRGLLQDPVGTVLNDTFKEWGITNPDFLENLIKKAIIKKIEKIDNGGGKDQFVIQYKVLDNPHEKIKALYNDYKQMNESVFANEKEIIEDILADKEVGYAYKTRGGVKLNEDGEGGGCACGSCGSSGGDSGLGGTSSFSMTPQGNSLGDVTVPMSIGKKKKDKDNTTVIRRSLFLNEKQAQYLQEYILSEAAELGTAFGNFGYDAPGVDASDNKFWGEAKNHNNMLEDPNLS